MVIAVGDGGRSLYPDQSFIPDACQPHTTTIHIYIHTHILSTYLDVGVDDELGEAQDLAREVEGVPEPRLLALLFYIIRCRE